jgi:thiamine kinase-like enzyme
MRKEFHQRLAKEYRYAVTKMQEVKQPAQKLYYFSVFFGEAQRVLNWEWDCDLVLIYSVTQHVHTQFNTTMQIPAFGVFPIDWDMVYQKLTDAASDLAAYYEKTENDDNRKEMFQTLGRLAEIAYAISGNGSYLFEKGILKL